MHWEKLNLSPCTVLLSWHCISCRSKVSHRLERHWLVVNRIQNPVTVSFLSANTGDIDKDLRRTDVSSMRGCLGGAMRKWLNIEESPVSERLAQRALAQTGVSSWPVWRRFIYNAASQHDGCITRGVWWFKAPVRQFTPRPRGAEACSILSLVFRGVPVQHMCAYSWILG